MIQIKDSMDLSDFHTLLITKSEYFFLLIQVCVMANAAHIEEAQANNIPYIDVDGLKAFNKDKTKIKKWCKKYDILLASDSVAKQVTKLLGNVLVKLGKFPIALAEG
jgi:large subunit ribosomal protein L10Ae